jgi:hypothetical protein
MRLRLQKFLFDLEYKSGYRMHISDTVPCGTTDRATRNFKYKRKRSSARR